MRSTDGPEVAIVRVAAVIQGLALVVIPTLSTVLTDPKSLHLSASAYGSLFVPQTLLAVICSFGGTALTRWLGPRTVLLIGFSADAVAMFLITTSALLGPDRGTAYVLLLCATSLLGSGFAIVTPTLNVLAGALAPHARDRAVLIVNALLGGSAAVAPLLLIAFVGLGVWWGLPLLCAIGMVALIAATSRATFVRANDTGPQPTARLPARLIVFAAFAFVYGVCEQLNGSWAPIYMARHLGASPALGSLALAVFWGVATASRVAFAVSGRVVAPPRVFCALPLVLAAAFGVLALLPANAPPAAGVAAFAFAGFGVSALLPLVLSFSERSVPGAATSATGVVFAVYLVGYGVAAFGVGPLQHWGISLPALDAAAVGLACVAAALAFTIVRTIGDHS